MKLEDRVRKLRDDAIARKQDPVALLLQGVTKARIGEVLRVLDLENRNCIEAVFALLDDSHDSWFTNAPIGTKFCDGASTGHVACHIGILQRGGTKLDREGRDYWIKPLRELGAIEPILLDSKTRSFLPGHPVAKSQNSAYRLAHEFRRILQASNEQWKSLLAGWIQDDRIRERRASQAESAEQTRHHVETSHADLIQACIEHYVPRFLKGFDVVYVDDADGERITDEDRDNLRGAGLDLKLDDAMPDVLLHSLELNELWVIEAVTSDGEVDKQKVERMVNYAERHRKEGVGFTTAYFTWKAAARRQSKHKNIAPRTYIWIREDPSMHYRADSFPSDGSRPSTIASTPS